MGGSPLQDGWRPPEHYARPPRLAMLLAERLQALELDLAAASAATSEATKEEMAATEPRLFSGTLFYRHAALVAFFCTYSLLFVLSTGAFLVLRREYSIRVRSVSLSVCAAMAGYAMMLTYVIVELELPLPCFVSLWSSNLFGALWITCFTVRAYRLLILNFYSARVMQLTSGRPGGAPLALVHKSHVTDRRLWRIVLVIMSAFAGWTLIVQCATSKYPLSLERTEPQCGGVFEFFHVYLWTGLNVFVGFPVILYLLDRCGADGFGIRRDTVLAIVCVLPLYIAYTIYVILSDVSADPQAAPDESLFSPSYFILAAVIVFHMTTIVLPLVRALRERYRRPRAAEHSSFAAFVATLDDPQRYQSFKPFLLADFSAENALFLEAYQRLRIQVRDRLVCGDVQEAGPSMSPVRRPGSVSCASPRASGVPSLPAEPAAHYRFVLIGELADRVPDEWRQLRVPAKPAGPAAPPGEPPLAWPVGPCQGTPVAPGAAPMSPLATAADELALDYDRLYRAFVPDGAALQLNLPTAVTQPLEAQFAADAWRLDAFDDAMEAVLGLMYDNTFPKYVRSQLESGHSGRVHPAPGPEPLSLCSGHRPSAPILEGHVFWEDDWWSLVRPVRPLR